MTTRLIGSTAGKSTKGPQRENRFAHALDHHWVLNLAAFPRKIMSKRPHIFNVIDLH